MKKLFAFLAILGFLLPSYWVLLESIETGNWFLYMDPMHTMEQMFANRISSIFGLDLLYGVLVFFVWSYFDAKEQGVKRVWIVWLLTMVFGLAGGFPYYLYLRTPKPETTD
ncbi:MAG: DUF2834 domain-containing protein [Bacteroidota bacterium]